jgi:hypothetical protein
MCVGFFPSEDSLLESSMEQLKNLKIQTIEYNSAQILSRLTFVFSDGSRSPPVNSYK